MQAELLTSPVGPVGVDARLPGQARAAQGGEPDQGGAPPRHAAHPVPTCRQPIVTNLPINYPSAGILTTRPAAAASDQYY